MEIAEKIIEAFGQIIGILFAYYLLRLAYKLLAKNRAAGAVLTAWAAVFIVLCSSQRFQGWAKSLIAPDTTAKLTAFGQQVDAVQKTTSEIHDQLANQETDIARHQKELNEIQSRIQDAEKNANTIQANTVAMHDQLENHQTRIEDQQKQFGLVQSRITEAEANIINQQSVMTNQFQQLLIVQSELASAQTNFSAQKRQLSDIENWAKNLFGKTPTETSTTQ
jgi:chromosome segregation ATPase